MSGAQNTGQPPTGPDDVDLQSLIGSMGSEGKSGLSVDQLWILNPVTGVWIPRRRVRLTRWDKRRGNVVDIDDQMVLSCWAGDVISDGETVVACLNCGRWSCLRHSIIDPFCGGTFCLQCTRNYLSAGVLLRICDRCYARLSRGWLRRAFDLLFGPH